MRVSWLAVPAVFTVCAFQAAPSAAETAAAQRPTIIGLVQAEDELSTLCEWYSAAGLLHGALDHPLSGPFTVLAPTNAAFDAVPNATKARLLDPANAAELVGVLTDMMVPAKACAECPPRRFPEAALADGEVLPTVAGDKKLVVKRNPAAAVVVSLNGSQIVSPDHNASNGLVHFVNAVILGDSVDDSVDDPAPPIPAGMRLMHSELALHCFVTVHAEARIPGTDTWASSCPTTQPFKSVVDTARRAVYWHKDDEVHDFYGEVWNYDDDVISLRQETFPHWPAPYDPPSAPWDVRPDKFRLFAAGGGGDATHPNPNRLPGGRGRVLAPVAFASSVSNWSHAGNMSTFLCRSWAELDAGNCTPYQPSFLDHNVTVRVVGDDGAAFSTVFDGAVAEDPTGQWAASAVMRDLQHVRVIDQQMAGCGGGSAALGRERFFFAQARNGTNLGIVRWDSATANASAPDGFTVTARTVGLRLGCNSGFNSSGFPGRRLHDTMVSHSTDMSQPGLLP
jgi:uncharacterized surface protein with fasciclin (FAS1) repeats